MASQPPVIAEIAKAYQNDPRTQLALNAVDTGSSTAPVAGGKYAYLDGIARALTGVAGGYINKKQMEKYGKDEDALLALRKARGEQGLDGLNARATAAAAALGAPPPQPTPLPSAMPPQGAPQGTVSAPPSAQSPQTTPALPQAPGVAPAVPFSAAGAAPSDNGVPLEAAPTAPQVQPATLSPRLRMAYQQMADANRYESTGAQDMMDKGLGEQGEFDERAAGRAQDVANTGYQAALQRYGNDRTQIRGQNFEQAQQGRSFEHDTSERKATQEFTLSRDEKQFAHEMSKAGFDRQTSFALATLNNNAALQRTRMEIEGRQATAAEKAAARQQAFFATKQGAEIYDKASQRVQSNGKTQTALQQFRALNQRQNTGGAILGTPAGKAVTWMNGNLQQMEAITQQLSIDLSGALKGAVSDKEGDRILKSLPSTRTKRTSNDAVINRLNKALERSNEFETKRLEAMADGNPVDFIRQWNAYNEDPKAGNVDNGISFDQWKASIPKYDATGKRVK